MNTVREHPLATAEAGLWWLSQAGSIVRAVGLMVVLDPHYT